ncbi:hypothetical protein SAMN05660297_03155 [Natronincola peptidivorans]|uniref:Uncharacterized protein n=1 Tax=Natronincola peptidivorans TaxID=426128 RepID=A0A1I0GFT7_9FIRM|nr:hypothetical protein [Natronincola peptidivorans]SET68887.1 hypothetical protein SAMN05660297_03155 [Natronincola peptidivorans]
MKREEELEYSEEDLREIELGLEELSLQLIDILNRYKSHNIIDDVEYHNHIKIKKSFLEYIKNQGLNQD